MVDMPSLDKAARLPAVLKPISLADVRKVASALNTIFARDPGTSFVFQYPARNSPSYESAVKKTEPLRVAMLQKQLSNPGVHINSAYVGNRIAGFAIWAAPKAQQRVIPWSIRIFDFFLQAWEGLKSLLYPDFLRRYFRSAYDKERLRRREAMMATDNEVSAAAIPEDIKKADYWQLTALGTAEEFGRRGIGSQLLQWGMDKADEADKAIIITASSDGQKLYKRHGFEVLAEATLLPDEPDGKVPQAYMIRWPRSARQAKEKD